MLIPNMILSTTYDFLLSTTKKYTNYKISVKRGFNGYAAVIGYADSEYDIVNKM